jgi:hypothetical protein
MEDGREYEKAYQEEVDQFLFTGSNFTVPDRNVKGALIARRQGETVLRSLLHRRILSVIGEISDDDVLGVGDLKLRFIGPMEENNDSRN